MIYIQYNFQDLTPITEVFKSICGQNLIIIVRK